MKELIPFSDEELRRMYDACEHQYGKAPIEWSREVHHRPARNEFANSRYKWSDDDLAEIQNGFASFHRAPPNYWLAY
jgi:hypothetical protein